MIGCFFLTAQLVPFQLVSVRVASSRRPAASRQKKRFQWPRIVGTALAALGTAYAQECGTCHRQEAEAAAFSQMSHALQPSGESDFLKNNPALSFRSGNYSYSIRRQGNQSIYSVAYGAGSISAPIEWALGAGVVGQTYLYRRDGALYEASVSFYPELRGLDWTPGHTERLRRNLEEAAGRKIDAAEAHRCFGCHSTAAVWSDASVPESLTPGVQCAQCHSGAPQHAAAVRRGDAAGAAMPKLAAMQTEELANLCGKCHPSWADIAANGPRGVSNVRFQFYRLTNSPCYDAADTRIACVACHDPHGRLVKDSSSYDAKCEQCHVIANARAKACPVSKQNCVTCHMPKVEVPGLHYQFTDHEIRIARVGEKYPD
jgi:Cytochrome c3